MEKETYIKPSVRSEDVEIGTYGRYCTPPICQPPGVELCVI